MQLYADGPGTQQSPWSRTESHGPVSLAQGGKLVDGSLSLSANSGMSVLGGTLLPGICFLLYIMNKKRGII